MAITMVFGMQFGDEGKGVMVRHLAKTEKFDFVVKTAGPNSGHSFYHGKDRFEFVQFPTASVDGLPIIFPSGSVINEEKFGEEIRTIGDVFGVVPEVYVHSMAALSKPMSEEEESFKKTVGTTGMGVGTARAEKMKRRGRLARDSKILAPYINDDKINMTMANSNKSLLVETGQGWGLSIDAGYYPYCTSKNVHPSAELDAMGLYVSRGHSIKVVGVMKPYPTRVPGSSGPLYGETTCEELGIPLQLSNVEFHDGEYSRAPARIGLWNDALVMKAMASLQPDVVCLAYADWLQSNLVDVEYGVMFSRLDERIRRICQKYDVGLLAVDGRRVLSINYQE